MSEDSEKSNNTDNVGKKRYRTKRVGKTPEPALYIRLLRGFIMF